MLSTHHKHHVVRFTTFGAQVGLWLLFFFTVSLSVASPSGLTIKCDRLLLDGKNPKTEFNGSTHYYLKNELPKEYQNQLQSLDALLGNLTVPSGIHFFFSSEQGQSAYEIVYGKLMIGTKSASQWSQNPSINLHTLSHEYGHAVLEDNMFQRNPSYRAFMTEYIFLPTLIENKTKEGVSYFERSKLLSPDSEVFKMLAEQAYEEGLLLNQRKKELDKYYSIRQSMHEFFADAMAVVQSKDPRAISQLLKSKQKNKNAQDEAKLQKNENTEDETKLQKKENKADERRLLDLLQRDFTAGRTVRDRKWFQGLFEKIQEKSQQNINSQRKSSSSADSSVVLSYMTMLPVRWAFWKMIKNKIESENFRRRIVPIVFDVLSSNMTQILEMPSEDLGQYGQKKASEINEKIIHDLEEAISKM